MRCPTCRRDYPPDAVLCPRDRVHLLQPLSAALQRGPLALTQAVKLIDRVLEILSGVHGAGRVHGALAPDAVFFRHRGAELALELTELTEPRATPLPVSYVPPERVLGASLDHRADLYAAGALFHHMLRGVAPFEGLTEDQLAGARIPSLLDPPGDRLQDLPEELDGLIRALLSKTPAGRPGSADEVRARLANLELDSTVMGVRLAAVRAVVQEVEAEARAQVAGSKPAREVVAATALRALPDDPLGETLIRPKGDLEDRELYPDADPSAFADTHLNLEKELIARSARAPEREPAPGAARGPETPQVTPRDGSARERGGSRATPPAEPAGRAAPAPSRARSAPAKAERSRVSEQQTVLSLPLVLGAAIVLAAALGLLVLVLVR